MLEFLVLMGLFTVLAAGFAARLRGVARVIVPVVLAVLSIIVWLTTPPKGGEYFENGVEIIPGLAHVVLLWTVLLPVLAGTVLGVLIGRGRERWDY